MKFFSKNNSINDDFFEVVDDSQPKTVPVKEPSHALTPEEILSDNDMIDFIPSVGKSHAYDSLRRKMQGEESVGAESQFVVEEIITTNTTTKNNTGKETSVKAPTRDESFLNRVKPYTVDEEGHDHSVDTQPAYQLESVAEILRTTGEKAIESLAKKYNIEIDNLGKKPSVPQQQPEVKSEPKEPPTKPMPPVPNKTDAFVRMVSDSVARRNQIDWDEPTKPATEEKAEQTESDSVNLISDIDNQGKPFRAPDAPDTSNTATIRFTPIKGASGNTDHVSISSSTQKIDITNDMRTTADETQNPSNVTLEENEFESYTPKTEFESFDDVKTIAKDFMRKKRSKFLSAVLSGLSLLALLFFLIPPLSESLISSPKGATIACAVITAISFLANIDMVLAIPRIISRKCTCDVPVTLAGISVALLTIYAIINDTVVYEILLLYAIILFTRALTKFWNISTLLGNFRQIATQNPKKSVEFISDGSTAFAMSKNTIDGDVLIATPRKTDFVSGFMKYSTFDTKLSGKIGVVCIVSVLLAVVSAVVAYGYFSDAYYAFYFAAAVLCLLAMPVLILIDSLPLRCTAKKLNRKGAMIAGKTAAEHLEAANAVVIASNDMFPSGTVTLHSIKVLSENSIDDTILRAASLTESVGSTLAPIFKKIAGTNTSYSLPNSDTVKYEEHLGLSGWVDDERLFIGNRTLMESHGITVPNVEIDRSILRKGYFPVYLASEGRACALIAIQYNVDPDVAKELRRITELGVTLLVTNSDPNISEEMLCDYFGLYEDSIKVVSGAGTHMYRHAVTPTKQSLAPAAFRTSAMTFITIMNCASRIKKSNALLTICYVLAAVLGIVLFVYTAFSGSGDPLSPSSILLYELAATAVSLLLFLFNKP